MFRLKISLRLFLPTAFAVALLFAANSIYAQKLTTEAYFETLARAEAKSTAKEWGEAAPLWEKIVKSNPVDGRLWNQLAAAYLNSKNYRQAIPAYEQAIELGYGTPYNSVYNIACAYALLGDRENALKRLEKAFDMGYPNIEKAQADEDLKSLRDDSRFQKILGLVDAAKLSRTEGWRSDLQFLAREINRRRYGRFSPAAEADFNAALKKLNDEVPQLTDAQIDVGIMKLMRKVGDGHSSIMGGNRPEFLQTLPVQFYLFEEGLFIISADPKYKELLGAQVLKFGPRTADEIIQGLEPVINRDNSIWIKQVAPYRMRNLPLVHALGLVPDAGKVLLTIRDREGKERTVSVAADTSQPDIWNTLPNPPEWINFTSTITAAAAPLYLKNMGAYYWFEYLPDSKTVYCQFNKVNNDPKESLAAFSERLFKFINENAIEKLVIDMRWNNGGNTYRLTPLVQGLIKNEKVNQRGRLFIITGRRTFSAAQNAATFFERHTNAMFVGEPTGSSPNFVGEEKPFTLPYSKVIVNVSDLYWESAFPQDNRTWIAPQIYVPPTFEAFRANRDPALEAILSYQK